MATKTVSNKELNEKVDKLTEMFAQFMQRQQPLAQNIEIVEEEVITKKPGRPRKQSIVEEPQIARKRRSNWENNFVDERKEHLDDTIFDKKVAVLPPVDKGVRKSAMIKSVCSSCDKQETVPRQFSFEGHHTCQKCLKNKVGK